MSLNHQANAIISYKNNNLISNVVFYQFENGVGKLLIPLSI